MTEATFLFSDIEGSTRLLQRLGDRYGRVLNEHRRLLRAAFAAHGGDELGTEGDSFFVVFDEPAGAVAGALAAQQALIRHGWPDDGRVSVRIGIHHGDASMSGGHYVGLAVHQAARVCSAGHGGQVLLSAAAAEAARAGLPSKATLVSLGPHPLKDFEAPEELFQLCHPSLVRDHPPLRTSGDLPTVALGDEPEPVREKPMRVLLVDDQEMVRAGFRMILEARGVEVAGEASDGRQAVDAVARLRPDVVLMDIRMPNLDGIEATKQVMAGSPPHPKVLILTTFDLDEYVFEALRAGASGFLLKDAAPDDLVHAVGVVAGGEALLAPSVTRRLIEEIGSGRRGGPVRPELAKAVDGLTAREQEVLTLVAKGLSNAEIGERLYVGEATVKTHVSNVLMKLGCRDRVQAVVLAYEAGVVTPGEG